MTSSHDADAAAHGFTLAQPGRAAAPARAPWGGARADGTIHVGSIHVGSNTPPTLEWAPLDAGAGHGDLLQRYAGMQATPQLTLAAAAPPRLAPAPPAEAWRVAPATAGTTMHAALASPPVERQVLLRPIGRRDGLLGLLGGLVLLGIPIVGAVALGTWQPAPAPKPAAPTTQLVTPAASVAPVATTTVPSLVDPSLAVPVAPAAPTTDAAAASAPITATTSTSSTSLLRPRRFRPRASATAAARGGGSSSGTPRPGAAAGGGASTARPAASSRPHAGHARPAAAASTPKPPVTPAATTPSTPAVAPAAVAAPAAAPAAAAPTQPAQPQVAPAAAAPVVETWAS